MSNAQTLQMDCGCSIEIQLSKRYDSCYGIPLGTRATSARMVSPCTLHVTVPSTGDLITSVIAASQT
jgi:hypothetical protein